MEPNLRILESVVDIQSLFHRLMQKVLSQPAMKEDVETASSFGEIDQRLSALTKSIISLVFVTAKKESEPVPSGSVAVAVPPQISASLQGQPLLLNVVPASVPIAAVAGPSAVGTAPSPVDAPTTFAPLSVAAPTATVSKSAGAVPKAVSKGTLKAAPKVAPQAVPNVVPPQVTPKSVTKFAPQVASKVLPPPAGEMKQPKEKKPKGEKVKSCFKCLGCGKFLANNTNVCRYGIMVDINMNLLNVGVSNAWATSPTHLRCHTQWRGSVIISEKYKIIK